MKLFDLPRWFFRWLLSLFVNKPTKFLVMRYYDVKKLFTANKENEAEATTVGKTRVRRSRSSGKTRRRRRTE